MKCTRCGNNLAKGSPYCPLCGQRFDNKSKCPMCGQLIDNTNAVCPFCRTVVNPQLLAQQRQAAAQAQTAKVAQPAAKPQEKEKKKDTLHIPTNEDEIYLETITPPDKVNAVHVMGAKRSICSMGTYKERHFRILYNFISLLLIGGAVALNAFFMTATELVAGETHSILTYFDVIMAAIGGFAEGGNATGLYSAIYTTYATMSYVQLATFGLFVLLQAIILVYGAIMFIVTLLNLFLRKASFGSSRKFTTIMALNFASIWLLAISGMGILPGIGMLGSMGVCLIAAVFYMLYNIMNDGRYYTTSWVIKSVTTFVLAAGSCFTLLLNVIETTGGGFSAAGGILSADVLVKALFGGGSVFTSLPANLAVAGGNGLVTYLMAGAGAAALIGGICLISAARRIMRELMTTTKIKCGIGARLMVALIFQGVAIGLYYYITIQLNAVAEGSATMPMFAYFSAGAILLTFLINAIWRIKTIDIVKKTPPEKTEQLQDVTQSQLMLQYQQQQQQMQMQQQQMLQNPYANRQQPPQQPPQQNQNYNPYNNPYNNQNRR